MNNPKKFARLIKMFPEDEYKELLQQPDGKQYFGHLNKNGRRNGLAILYDKTSQALWLATYYDGELLFEQETTIHQLKPLELREDGQTVRYFGQVAGGVADGVGLLIFPDNQNQVCLFNQGEVARHILMNAIGRQVKKFLVRYNVPKTSDVYSEFPFGVVYKIEFKSENGDRYVGDADETGERHGEGEFTWKNGNARRSIYKQGKEIRWLEHKFPNGDKILYEDKVNEKEYLGVKVFKNGDKFDGIIEGVKLVQGTYIFKNGEQEEREYDRTTQEVLSRKVVAFKEQQNRNFGADDQLQSALNMNQQDIELGMSMEPQELQALDGQELTSLVINSGVVLSENISKPAKIQFFAVKDAIQNDDINVGEVMVIERCQFSDVFGSGKILFQHMEIKELKISRCFVEFQLENCQVSKLVLEQTDLTKIIVQDCKIEITVESECSGEPCAELAPLLAQNGGNGERRKTKSRSSSLTAPAPAPLKMVGFAEFENALDNSEASQQNQRKSSQGVRPKVKQNAPCAKKTTARRKPQVPVVGKLVALKKLVPKPHTKAKDNTVLEDTDDLFKKLFPKPEAKSFDFNSKFKNCEIIGSGNIAFVSRLEDGDEVFALKTFNNPARSGAEFNFLLLNHPHIVRASQIFEWKGKYCVQMECLDNSTTLATFVDDNLDADPGVVWPIFTQLATAISYMHGLGVLHLCLTAENVFLQELEDGFVEHFIKISDAGFAQSFGDESIFAANPIVNQFLVPPECIQDDGAITKKADAWQLGMLLYYMCMGKFPFGRQELTQHLHAQEPLDTVLCEEMAEFQPVLDRLLITDTEKRISVQELVQDPSFVKVQKYIPVLKMQSEKDVLGTAYFAQGIQYIKQEEKQVILNFNEVVVDLQIPLDSEPQAIEIVSYSSIIIQSKIQSNLQKLVLRDHFVYVDQDLFLLSDLAQVVLVKLESQEFKVNIKNMTLEFLKIWECKISIIIEDSILDVIEMKDQNFSYLNFDEKSKVTQNVHIQNCDGEPSKSLKTILNQFELSDY